VLGRGSWKCENEGGCPGITMYIKEDVHLMRAMKKEQVTYTKSSVCVAGV